MVTFTRRDMESWVYLSKHKMFWFAGAFLGVWLEGTPESEHIPSKYLSKKEITNLNVHRFWQLRIDQTGDEGKWIGFPFTDVVFYWDIPYYYYARSRQDKNGTVPLSLELTKLKSPVTFNINRQPKFDLDPDSDTGEWIPSFHPLYKSTLLKQ